MKFFDRKRHDHRLAINGLQEAMTELVVHLVKRPDDCLVSLRSASVLEHQQEVHLSS